jgi:hypothetical protein
MILNAYINLKSYEYGVKDKGFEYKNNLITFD